MKYERYESVLADARRATRYYFGWMDADFAEDLTLQLLSKMPTDATDGWHRVSIRRACIAALQRQSRHTPDFPLHATLPAFDRWFDLESRLERLQPDALAILYLVLAGYTHKEIAEQRGCSEAAARAKLAYTLRQIRAA